MIFTCRDKIDKSALDFIKNFKIDQKISKRDGIEIRPQNQIPIQGKCQNLIKFHQFLFEID